MLTDGVNVSRDLTAVIGNVLCGLEREGVKTAVRHLCNRIRFN